MSKIDPVLDLPLNEGSGTTVYDRSGYNNHGTIYGASWQKIWRDWILSFDGVDDYVEVSIFPLTDKVTVEAWALFIDGQPAGNYGGIICNLNGYNNVNRLLLTSTSILFQLRIGGNIYSHTAIGLPDLRNKWNHYVATYDGSNVRIYLNSSKVYEGSQSGALDSGTTKPTIGWGSVYSSYYHLKGLIGEVRIYNRALTDAQIQVLYNLFRGELRKPPSI